MVEHQAVAGTAHWLQTEGNLLNLKFNHVVRVVVPVTQSLPQLAVVNAKGCLEIKSGEIKGGELAYLQPALSQRPPLN